MTPCMLITGGAGFIGSNLVRLALHGTSARVVVLDKLTYAGSRENLADSLDDERLTFVEGDIADRAAVAEIFARHTPSAVLNLAAESHVDRSIDDPRAFLETNVTGTFELLEASRRLLADAEPGTHERFRFLHVSTDEVYGSLAEDGRFREDTPYAPSSPYSASKAAADHLVRAYGITYGLPTLVTNCSNNYGPFQFPEKLVPLTILNAIEARDLPIYGDGSHVRDWIYVDDHCRGLLAVLERGRPGETYNLGAENERTNLATVDLICDLLDEELPASENPAMAKRGCTRYRELETFVEDRPGHDLRYAIDPSKARQELGWQPEVDFEEGMRRTIRWYVERHRDGSGEAVSRYGRERLGLLQA